MENVEELGQEIARLSAYLDAAERKLLEMTQHREQTPATEERSVRTRLLPGGMVKLEVILELDEADLILRAVERSRRQCD